VKNNTPEVQFALLANLQRLRVQHEMEFPEDADT
jgi:hypothetical protein